MRDALHMFGMLWHRTSTIWLSTLLEGIIYLIFRPTHLLNAGDVGRWFRFGQSRHKSTRGVLRLTQKRYLLLIPSFCCKFYKPSILPPAINNQPLPILEDKFLFRLKALKWTHLKLHSTINYVEFR